MFSHTLALTGIPRLWRREWWTRKLPKIRYTEYKLRQIFTYTLVQHQSNVHEDWFLHYHFRTSFYYDCIYKMQSYMMQSSIDVSTIIDDSLILLSWTSVIFFEKHSIFALRTTHSFLCPHGWREIFHLCRFLLNLSSHVSKSLQP